MANAKLIESTEKFVVVLERSQLFAPNQLEAIKKLAQTAGDPLPIARTLVKKGWLTKWQASQLLSGFYNLKLGKYHLSDHLGKGELGNVYLAENPKLGRKVALKSLSKQHSDAPELVKRFISEASAAAALDHPNIVHIHDVSSEGQRHYVVMEYVTGRDLQSRVDAEGPLSFDEAASVVRQAAEGLQHAHEHDVIHRDIKPANLMVDDQGVAKILDIGVGHLRRPDSNPSDNTGELMMSAVAYMAPEHARDRAVDARCDVYSLGGVLYFLLTGRAPFSTKNDSERAKIKASKLPIPLTDLRPDTPQELVDLCNRMMALQADDRFASMAEVLAALASSDGLIAGGASSSEQTDLAEVEPEELVAIAEPEDEATGKVTAEKKSELESKPEVKSAPKGTTPAIKIDLGDSARPVAAVAPMDFAINTKKRKKKKAAVEPAPAPKEAADKPAAAKNSEPAADAAASGDLPTTATPKKGLSKGLIIGGACAAGLLLITGVGVGAMMMLGSGGKEVVEAAPVATESASETTEGDPVKDATEEANAAEDGSATATSESGTDASDPSAVSEATSEGSAEDAGAAASASATAPAEGTGDAVAAEPAAAAATTGETVPTVEPEVVQTVPKTETPTSEQPAEAKPAEPQPEPEEKPAPEKAPEKQAPAKPKTFAFETAIDLPTPAADAPELTLGEIRIRPEDAVFISLDGGDIAAAGRYEFSVQNAQDGVAPRDWEFYLSDGNSDPVVIATMSLPEKELKFKWTPAGVENSTATNLRNCSLKITAGQDQPQNLALRTPQKVAPVSIDIEKSSTAKLSLEGAPDRSSLKMEVTVKGHKSLVEPAQISLGKGGEAAIYFGENQEQAAVALKLSASLNARGIKIDIDPYFLVPVEKSPVRLNKASIKKYQAFQTQQAALQSRLFEGQKAINENKLSPQQKAQAQGVLADWKQQLELIDKTVAKMAQLSTDMAAIGSGASLQFRVFSDTLEKQIDLIVTDPNAVAAAP